MGNKFEISNSLQFGESKNTIPIQILKHNSLIQLNQYLASSSQGKPLTLMEKKLFAFAISKLDQSLDHFTSVTFTVNEIYNIIGMRISSGHCKESIYQALENLHNKTLWVVSEDPETHHQVEELVCLIKKARLIDKKHISLEFDDGLAPALLGLPKRKCYTKLCLNDLMHMKTTYAFSLYELLCSYEYTHMPQRYTFDALRNILGCPKYKRSADFKKRVIDDSVTEINNISTGYRVHANYEKTGNELSAVVFEMTPCMPQTDSKLSDTTSNAAVRTSQEDVKEQISYEQIVGILKLYPDCKIDMSDVDNLVDIIADVYDTHQKTFRLSGRYYKKNDVVEQYHRIDMGIVFYALQQVKKQNGHISNLKSYYRATLFNAVTENPAKIIDSGIGEIENIHRKVTDRSSEFQPGEAELEAIQNLLRESEGTPK